MSAPIRIQRKRERGWKMPPNTVYVGRPTKWGNPFDWRAGVEMGGEAWAKSAAVGLLRNWLYRPADFPEERAPPNIAEIKAALRGENLCCWCPLVNSHGEYVPCHADVLLELANR